MTDRAGHWNEVYATKRSDAVSWYAPHLDVSMEIVAAIASNRGTSIVDVGGGAATFVDDLLAAGYDRVAVLDVARTAVWAAKRRLGDRARRVDWYVDDVTRHDFGWRRFDLWHDRAVFHFLTDPADRAAYVERVRRAVRPGGHVIVATFGPQGPERCSDLPVVRYDAAALETCFGAAFERLGDRLVAHTTPKGAIQQFQYVWWRVRPSGAAQTA